MKRNAAFTLLILSGALAWGVDFESYRFIDHLLAMTRPTAPHIFEDAVIFTAPSDARRVGISFAHEGFSKVYYFRKLLKSGEAAEGSRAKGPVYLDTGILFHVQEFPRTLRELEYRLVVDGLWTSDPRNPLKRVDPASGIVRSVVSLPEPKADDPVHPPPPGSARFRFRAVPGETITVAGSFNNWDPFMYELNEESPGNYLLTLPLPAGIHRYVFIHNGNRILDPDNPRKVYAEGGKTASELMIR